MSQDTQPAAAADRRVEGFHATGDGHEVHWIDTGPADGVPVMIVHGGPGGGINERWGEFFPDCRRIFVDQRGCGLSRPFGSTENNTTALLVEDMDAIREALGVERWLLFGGSWGTTLAIAYGAAHPDRCLGFLLRGVFLARQEDTDFFLWGVRRHFPEVHAAFLDAIERAAGRRPTSAREILELAHEPLLRGGEAAEELATAWARFEFACSSVAPMPPFDAGDAASRKMAVPLALLERHYMACELPPAEPILEQAKRCFHLPCAIAHGRFDLVCPVDQAVELAAAWPGASLRVGEGAGHWTFDPPVAEAIRGAAAELLAKIAAQGAGAA
jgi:proline iminopeptidase